MENLKIKRIVQQAERILLVLETGEEVSLYFDDLNADRRMRQGRFTRAKAILFGQTVARALSGKSNSPFRKSG